MPWHMRKMKTLTEKRFFEWHEDDTSVTLRNVSASYGGGQRGACYCVSTIGSLCYDDYKGPNRQYVCDGKLIIEIKENADV